MVRGEAMEIMHARDIGEILQVAWVRSGCGRLGDHASRLGEIRFGRHGDHPRGLEGSRLVRDIGDHASILGEIRSVYR